MIMHFGEDYFRIVPGIYSTSANFDPYNAMNSDAANTVEYWRALDGGPWFVRKEEWLQPSGDYTPYCWLEMNDWTITMYQFDDNYCSYTVDQYLCSTNDKGGKGYFERVDGIMKYIGPGPGPDHYPIYTNVEVQAPYPEGAESGKYVISYHVKDWDDNSECDPPKRTVIVKDTMAPRIYLWDKQGPGGTLLQTTKAEHSKWSNGFNGEKNFQNLTHLQDRRRSVGAYDKLIGEFNLPVNHEEQRRLLGRDNSGSNSASFPVLILGCTLSVLGGVLVVAIHSWRARSRVGIEIIDL
jgi:hypothetical protein